MKLCAAGILFPAFEIKILVTFVHESSVSFEVFIHALKCTLHFTFPTCMLSTFMTRHVLQTTFVETVCHKQGI